MKVINIKLIEVSIMNFIIIIIINIRIKKVIMCKRILIRKKMIYLSLINILLKIRI
jgi:hypothetical protein